MTRTVVHSQDIRSDALVVHRCLDEKEEALSYTVDLIDLNGDERELYSTSDRTFALGFAHGYYRGRRGK